MERAINIVHEKKKKKKLRPPQQALYHVQLELSLHTPRLYLPTLTHYARVSRLLTKNIDLTHQGQFLTPDSQIRKIKLNFPQ